MSGFGPPGPGPGFGMPMGYMPTHQVISPVCGGGGVGPIARPLYEPRPVSMGYQVHGTLGAPVCGGGGFGPAFFPLKR